MVSFSFRNKSYTDTREYHIEVGDVLPDDLVLDIWGPFDSDDGSDTYNFLTRVLRSSPKNLDEIHIYDLTAESPEALAFLVLMCNKTDELFIWGRHLSMSAASCLMTALSMGAGVRTLSYNHTDDLPMPTNQARIMLEGVASSPSLERFLFDIPEFIDADNNMGMYFIEALQRNQSLRDIDLHTTPIRLSENDSTFLASLARTSISRPNMKSVCLMDSHHELGFDVLQEVLSREGCTLESLFFSYVEISTMQCLTGSDIQNLSVTSLTIMFSHSGSENFRKIVNLFKSLTKLDLRKNQITELSFLDPLLFGKSSQLESLNIYGNPIGEEEMTRFIKKLRAVRGLKHLGVCDGWRLSDATKAALIDALKDNTDLENADFGRGELPLDLNRGGRRILESSQPFPPNLLPRVLERASKISYYRESDNWGSPTNEKPRADVVFWMVQRIVPQLCVEMQ